MSGASKEYTSYEKKILDNIIIKYFEKKHKHRMCFLQKFQNDSIELTHNNINFKNIDILNFVVVMLRDTK